MNEVKRVNKYKAYKQILKVIGKSYYNLSARQISVILFKSGLRLSPHRQEVAPRLTELLGMGAIEKCEKIYDSQSKKMVTTFRINKDIENKKEGENINNGRENNN